VLTTSPTFRQVRTQLWTEIHRATALSGFGFGAVKATELKLRGDHNRALGLSTNRAENFQGYHGRQVLIIADEAPGIPSGIWDAIAGTMAGGKVHVVMAGNPTIPSGAFYDAFTRERKNWNCITIDSFDSPNLAGITLPQLLEMDSAPGGPLDHNPVPFLVTKRWVYDQYRSWWHGDERSSPSWVSRVRGQFPDQAAARFANEKARRYQNLADAFERDLVEGLTDDETIAQAVASAVRDRLTRPGEDRIQGERGAARRTLAGPRRGFDAGTGRTSRDYGVQVGARAGGPLAAQPILRGGQSPAL
jgi:hypothetical protein